MMNLLCVAVATGAMTLDNPDVRVRLQGKYDAVDAAMNSGNRRALAKFASPNSFVATDLQKRTSNLTRYLNQSDKAYRNFRIDTVVESADTLNGKAKAALSIQSSYTLIEGGKVADYRVVKTQEDTWLQVGPDWKLIGARLTSHQVIRNGKVILNQREHVLTDWDRHYRRRASRG